MHFPLKCSKISWNCDLIILKIVSNDINTDKWSLSHYHYDVFIITLLFHPSSYSLCHIVCHRKLHPDIDWHLPAPRHQAVEFSSPPLLLCLPGIHCGSVWAVGNDLVYQLQNFWSEVILIIISYQYIYCHYLWIPLQRFQKLALW